MAGEFFCGESWPSCVPTAPSVLSLSSSSRPPSLPSTRPTFCTSKTQSLAHAISRDFPPRLLPHLSQTKLPSKTSPPLQQNYSRLLNSAIRSGTTPSSQPRQLMPPSRLHGFRACQIASVFSSHLFSSGAPQPTSENPRTSIILYAPFMTRAHLLRHHQYNPRHLPVANLG